MNTLEFVKPAKITGTLGVHRARFDLMIAQFGRSGNAQVVKQASTPASSCGMSFPTFFLGQKV